MQNVCLVTAQSINKGVWTPETRDKAGVVKAVFHTLEYIYIQKKTIYNMRIKSSFYWPVFNVQCSTTVVVAQLETIKVLAIAFTKNVLKAFGINFCSLFFEVFSIVQLVIAVHFIQIFEWI